MQLPLEIQKKELFSKLYSPELLEAHEATYVSLQGKTPPGWDGYSTPVGWAILLQELDNEIEKIMPGYTLNQCKEKFGGLRYYIDYPENASSEQREQADTLISEIENKSMSICTVCGEAGKTTEVTKYWVDTLCEKHRKPENVAQRRELYDKAWKA